MAVSVRTETLRIVAGDETIVDLDQLQGLWTEEQYLRLTKYSRRLLEFSGGSVEVLPMPTKRHQIILRFLFLAFYLFTEGRGGTVLFAPLRLRIREGKYREPDLLLLVDADDPRGQEAYWLGADMVAEIVSPDDPERDIVTKRVDYAEAGVPEYWIVNPVDESVMVLRLQGNEYVEHGIFRRGDAATSVLLPDFAVSVDEVFDAR
jgi:Uma2 family endonuclease